MHRNLLLLTALAATIGSIPVCYAGQNRPAVFYVAQNGNDAWSGRLDSPNSDRTDGPFAGLPAALQAARKLPKDAPRKIVIGAGRYFLDKTLVLDERDAGLTIESHPSEKVFLYGGRKVTNWKKDGDNFYSAALDGVREKKWDFRALIVNERYCPRARLPEKGTFTHLTSFDVPWMSTTGGGWKRKPTHEELTTLKYRPEDLGDSLDVNNAEITVYHMWDESLIGLAGIDPESNTLKFSSPAGHPPGAFGVKKYVVWNIRNAMTRPGTWYLDRTAAKIVYWPLPGEDMAKADVLAPVLEAIIKIRQTSDVTIKGLNLAVTTTPLKAGGFGAGLFDGAVSVASSKNCLLANLDISNVGGQGIKASGTNIDIVRCSVHHTGACGIRCSGTKVTVTDNHIHDIGLTYPSAIALQGGGADSTYAHNEIHDAPYTAVNCGGRNNRIEHNLIYRAMTELHDGGGIYCFAGNGLVLRGNFIRDIIDTGGYGASAYYLDERSENCLVEGNLSVGIVRPSHNHMAKGNTIRNNVFLSDTDLHITFARSSGYIFERNVLLAAERILIDSPDRMAARNNNCFFSRTGKIEANNLNDYASTGVSKMQPGPGDKFEDPKIIEFDTGAVVFAPDSPIRDLGIKPINVSDAGPRP